MIAGATAMLPQGADSMASMWRVSAGGHDLVSEVPASRWEPPSAAEAGSEAVALRARFGAFVHGAEWFDHEFFGVSVAEASAMDPQQRLLLERGYEALHATELRRAELMGSATGVFLGIAGHDFVEVLKASPAGRSVYAATGSSHSIAAGRLSFVLGLQGPCVSYDTACSSALAAGHAAWRAVQLSECDVALLEAISLMLLPAVGMAFAVAGMTSVNGRCHTFDARADGFVRGEACGATALQRSPGPGLSVWLRGAAVRQDGRRASLTAPNGAAQRALLQAALAEAGVAAASVARLEAHGTGTALGDPIEAGSLRAAMLQARDEAQEPLALGGVKANCGHGEPAAAMSGLLVLAAGLSRGLAVPNAQLRRLNPRVGEALQGGAACALPTGLVAMKRSGEGLLVGGVSSFGYSGTIAHALLQSAPHIASSVVGGGAAVRFRRRAFAWAEPTHPLLQRRLSAPSGCAALFRSPVAGPLHALMADHVVRGRIIFPGAGYLETARAACSATTSSSAAGAALNGVFFLQPLALEEGGAAWVECALLDSGTFEVRSGSGEAVVAVHCSGHRAAADAAAWRPLGLAAMRERCCNVADTSALYAAFLAMGIDYGPAFRALEAAWECGSEATARLRRRSSLAGTQVHPADLDNALQSTALLRRDGSSQETRLPFAVDSVLMRGPAAGVLWALASASGADAADVALGSDDGIGKAQLDGFRTRTMRSAAGTAREHMYQTVLREAPGRSSASAGAILLLGSSSDPAVLRLDKAPQALLAGERPVIVVTAAESLLPLPALAMALQLVSSMSGSRVAPPTVWLLSASMAISSARSTVGVAMAGSWGLGRAARAELPALPLGCASSDGLAPATWPWMLATGAAPPGEPEVEWSGGGFKVPRLAAAVISAVESEPLARSSQVLTGGTGGLGLLTARWLAESRGAPALVLASRSGALARGGAAEWALLGASGAAVRIARCDAADPAAVAGSGAMQRCAAAAVRRVARGGRAVGRAAGPADGGDAERACTGRRRTRVGAAAGHGRAAARGVRALLVGGGAAGRQRGAGQLRGGQQLPRRAGGRAAGRGARGRSVQWGPWAEVGMAAGGAVNARLQAQGWGLVGLARGWRRWGWRWRGRAAVVAMMPVSWGRMLGGGVAAAASCRRSAPARLGGAAGCARLGVGVLETVLALAARTAGGAVDADAPLMEAGLDSLGAVELRNQLQQAARRGRAAAEHARSSTTRQRGNWRRCCSRRPRRRLQPRLRRQCRSRR